MVIAKTPLNEKQWDNLEGCVKKNTKHQPPKNFEKVEKLLEETAEKNKGKTNVRKEDIPKEVWNYLESCFNTDVLPEGYENWPPEDRKIWREKYYIRYIPGYPKSLTMLFDGLLYPGDNGRPPSEVPEWLDMEKFRRGQKFAQDNMFSINFHLLMSFLGIYTFGDQIRPVIMTKKSTTVYNAFHRYMETIRFLYEWYTSDIFTPGTEGYKKMQMTRKMHQITRRQICMKTPEEFREISTIKQAWCPLRKELMEEFKSACPIENVYQRPFLIMDTVADKPKGLNQADMSITQFGFVGLLLLYPKSFGIHNATDEDLDAFCYVWRVFGFLLGIYDEFNFCSGSLEETKQRSRDVTDYWVKQNLKDITPEWEHLLRCITSGIGYYFIPISFEVVLLYTVDLLEIPMPRLYASLDFSTKFLYKLIKFIMHYCMKVPGVRQLLNKTFMYTLNRASNFPPEKLQKLKESSNQTFLKHNIVL